MTSCQKKTTQVGIVLPTKVEPRWILDQTRFLDALKNAGFSAKVLFSQGDSAKEKANVEALIAGAIKVLLIICPHDGTAAAAAAELAHKAGVKVISYDRLFRDTDAVDYYVTFDIFMVGAAWGDYLVSQVPAGTKSNNLYLYAGAASDNNSFIFFEGAISILQPKIADGTFIVRNIDKAMAFKNKPNLTRDEMSQIIAQVTTNWNFNDAKSKAEANLTAVDAKAKGTVYICAPNDGAARAIADAFAADKDVKKITLFVFISMGIFSGLSGILFTARLKSATPQAGTLFELDAIAACYIGGVSAAGGIGSITGSLIGALVYISLMNGMNLLGIDISLQYVIRGLVLVGAVIFDVASRRRK